MYEQRAEILRAIKYVTEVVPSPWLVTDNFISKHSIDILVHGDDNSNEVSSCSVVNFPRTKGISSTLLRRRSHEIYASQHLEKNLGKES